MRRFNLFTAVFSIYLGLMASSAWAANYNFPKVYNFNGNEWKLGYQNESEHTIIAEYVTDKETVKNWTQLFTYQVLKKALPTNVTPRDFGDHVDAALKGQGIDYKFKVLSASDDEAMIEFQVWKPLEQQQDEIQRIIKTPKGIFVLMHYVIKRPDMGKELRAQWVKNLNSTPLVIL